jgi:long-chain fatty acid transport protein
LKHKYLPLVIAAALSALSASAGASGYRFGSQSVSAQGTADANGAEANDASTIFYNPAGLSRLDGTQMSVGGTIVVPHSTYTDQGSTHFTGAPVSGGNPDDYVPKAVVAPSFYLSKKLDSQWTVGLGMFVPYGSNIDFGSTWVGRYALGSIKLEAVTLNPSASFKLNEHHSFGFGIDAEHMDAKLKKAIDVPGTIAALSSGPGAARGAELIKNIAALGGNPALLRTVGDGHVTLDGKDWGYGFNLGYMFTLDEATRFGLSYRSSVVHKLRGDTVWNFDATTDPIINHILSSTSGKVNSKSLVSLRTPESLSANVYHQFDSKWTGLADVTWSRHSRLQDLHLQFPPTTEGDLVIQQRWKNTVRVSVGGNYNYSEALTLRAGVAYDQSPVQSAELTHPALPDSDRMQYSFGANFKLNARSSIDLAYSYLDFKNAQTRYADTCNTLTPTCTGNGEVTRGEFKTNLQLIGIAYNYKF